MTGFKIWLIGWCMGYLGSVKARSWGFPSISFFYDTLKILLLLLLITTLMGMVNAYFPIERLRDFLQRKKIVRFGKSLSIFFLGLLRHFALAHQYPCLLDLCREESHLGSRSLFLITSPLVNEIALAMFIGLFGLKFTVIYAVTGILLGTIGGIVLGKMGLEKHLSEWVQNLIKSKTEGTSSFQAEDIPFLERLKLVVREAFGIVKSIVIYVLIGIGIGAAMHGYVPENFFAQYLGSGQWWTVPLAVIVAVPLYSNAAGIIPVIQVLVAKGVPIGTSIAFMMATIGLSIPEATLLKKVMTARLIGIYFGVVTLFIIISGYLFNLIL
ncbi:permease [Algoriphagus boritolerans]|uniref:permease n=1 Tax=Algoriphagus boritolerans TaxID=308111 RepID=UPI000AD33729